ncbi:MAG: hypothetical protein OSB30_06125 [Candidatus Poseidoniaceae archaeon]|nr:hypothetical protein [Candidatus Poseidoniaceae archaeon]
MGERMSSSNIVTNLVCALLIAVILAPLVSASGGGAVIDVSSILLGEMETFEDSDLEVPFTIVEQSGLDAEIEVNVVISTLEGTELHNLSTNYTVLAFGSTPVNYTFSNMPYGYSNLIVTMAGDLGTEDSNNVTGFNRTIQRLRPAQLSIEGIELIPVNFNGAPTGNATLRDGDYLIISASMENLGDLQWSSDVTADINGQEVLESHMSNITFGSATTTNAQFYSSSSFSETNSDINSHYTVNISILNPPTSQSELFHTSTFEVGPPPLARIDMELVHLNTDVTAGSLAQWNLSIANTGEIDYNGTLSCIFSGGEIEYSQPLDLANGINTTISISASARPGTLTCQTDGQRVWDDSISSVSSILSMTAAAFEAAGSSTPAVLGGPWHKGDMATFSMLVRNHGDSDGLVQLRCEINGVVSLSEPLSLALDAAGEVSVSIQMIATGQTQVNWSLVSSNGAIDIGLEGVLNIPVSEQQSLAPQISTVEWDSVDGISFTWHIDLDTGVEREIQLRLGYDSGGSEIYPFDSLITVFPGLTTGQYVIGHVDADNVVIRINSINWTIAPGPTSAIKSVPSERPEYSVEMNPLSSPRDPTFGDETSITIKISNNGLVDGTSGQILLVDGNGNLLVQSETDLLLAGEEKEITLTIDWPSGSEVTLTAKWSIDQNIFTSSQSYNSGASTSSTQSYDIPLIGIISGIAIAGAVILVMRLKNSASERKPSSSKPKNKTPKAKKPIAKSKTSASSTDRKVQVGCPECARQLRVPASYSGKVRCPDCSNRFDVSSRDESHQEEEEVEEVEKQEKKEVSCPDCSQSLRVPTDYSGSVRCPACKVVFKADSQ